MGLYQQSYRMPAEWEVHTATWLAWPHNPETWLSGVDAAEEVWIEIIRALREPVSLLVNDLAMERHVKELLREEGIPPAKVILFRIPTDDAWIRDYGPTFVESRDGPIALDWIYNAWGGKYPPWDRDAAVAAQIPEAVGIPRRGVGLVLEGGSIDVNGKGLLLTTEQCLLNPNRNPHFSKGEIEERLRGLLGADEIIWLGEGIAGDDTDGHVDDIARFVDPETIVVAVTDDRSDENFAPLQESLERLEPYARSRGLKVVRLPMPGPVRYRAARLPASYTNFYIANRVVLVPLFDDPQDREALAVLRPLFPGRRIVGIPARDLVIGLGGVHCVTHQQP